MLRMKLAWLVMASATLVAGSPVAAQSDYPSRPVTLIVPYPTGGSTDAFARALAERLPQRWGQPVVVENRPGASGVTGMMAGRDAPPNGYTLLLAMSGPMAGNPTLMSKLPYDPLKDYSYIAGLMTIPLLFGAHLGTPYGNFKEFVDASRRTAVPISVGSGGTGTSNHMALELFKSVAGIKLLHVPYKGAISGMADLIGGHIPVLVMGITESLPNIKAGKIRPLALTGAKRAPQLPDLPTVAELGYPGYELVGWGGIVAPVGTPRPVVQKIATDIERVVAEPAFIDRVLQAGLVPEFRDGDAFREYVRSEITKWGKVVREARIALDQ